MNSPDRRATMLSAVFPLLGPLRGYRGAWLRGDVLAGFVAAAVLIPQALAYGQQAGLPPATGLYTVIGAAVGFALFTATRTVAVGPASLTAAATLEVVQGHAGGDPARAVALASALSVMAGLVCLAAAALRLSVITEFLSQPVLLGYLTGTALTVVASQSGKLVGVQLNDGGPLARLWQVLTHLDQAHMLTAGLSVFFIALYVLLRRYLPAIPVSLVIVAVAIVLSAAGHLERHGVALVGPVSGGLPAPILPVVGIDDLGMLLAAAVTVTVIISAESVTAGRRAIASGQPIRFNRELAALGSASAAAGVLGGFPPMASTSRGVSARSTGAHTQVFQLVLAGLAVGALLLSGPLIARLPVAALAVLAVFGALKLVDLSSFRCIWRGWRYKGVLALATAAGVAVLGVLAGILVAVILAMWDLIRRVARPHDAVLEVGNPDEPPHAVAEQKPTSHPQVLIYRVDAPLIFANANHVSDRILMLADARGPQLRSVMLDAEAIFYLDATAAAMLARITVELRRRGCGLVLARVREPVVQALHTSPYEQGITRELQIFPSVREAYAFIQRDSSKP